MSPGDNGGDFAGVSWGSNHFRAYRIAPTGALVDAFSRTDGVLGLDRSGLADVMAGLVARWPGLSSIWASGMIGSALGWIEVPYAPAPAGRDELARSAVPTTIGQANVRIVPGIACTRSVDGAPDILRGEEIELLGLPQGGHDTIVILPGAHTKWVSVREGRIADFFTSMTGEMFNHLTAQGLLASIVVGEAEDGDAFRQGLSDARDDRLTLGTAVFGVRARVMRGMLAREDATSYLRGLLIGSELADARRLLPDLVGADVTVIGRSRLADLYAAALANFTIRSRRTDPHAACIAGFHALQSVR
jgi:2-dehydro-3-deoxygalactonokinase